MLTIFTSPKAFKDKMKTVQINAIKSWLALEPKCEVLIFGDDEGAKEVAQQLGLKHIPKITTNEYGTPLVSAMFEVAQNIAAYEVLAYVNADIILFDSFIQAIKKIKRSSFLMIGARYDLDFDQEVDFSKPAWRTKLLEQVRQRGNFHGRRGIDYFVFNKGLYKEMPPFALGRSAWDNWLVYYPRAQKAAVIDATSQVLIIHQNHDYSHQADDPWKGKEAKCNQQLAGGPDHLFGLDDTTHVLTQKGIRIAFGFRRFLRYFDTLPVFYPFLYPLKWLRDVIKMIFRPVVKKTLMFIRGKK